jgi:hypothetical protein
MSVYQDSGRVSSTKSWLRLVEAVGHLHPEELLEKIHTIDAGKLFTPHKKGDVSSSMRQ